MIELKQKTEGFVGWGNVAVGIRGGDWGNKTVLTAQGKQGRAGK